MVNLRSFAARKISVKLDETKGTVLAKTVAACVILMFITLFISPALADIEAPRNGSFAEALVSPTEVTPNMVVLDISPSADKYIEGSVNLNYEGFLGEGGQIKPVSEIAGMLGDAGISSNDSLVITGECLPCGGGPSPAVFTYWLLKYLGHESARVLDGSVDDWAAAGLNTTNKSTSRPKTNYTPNLKPELLANYDFVVNGRAQIVDARPAKDFGIASIPEAINIPYESVVDDEMIRSEEALEKVFTELDKEKPVVVYSNAGIEASLVWFALTLSGYDARLYTWRDWLQNQPKLNLELEEITARPNPVRSGEAVTITASFGDKQPEMTKEPVQLGNTKLTVQGCATCGFGSPQSFASLDRDNGGFVQIGSKGKASNVASSIEGSLRCTAIINGPDGLEAGRTTLLHTSGDTYIGIWNADVDPGVYEVSIVASSSSNSEAFQDVLEIEVTG
jgi:thiosulfate/3-mercaptopyruvate sulfurtransferase